MMRLKSKLLSLNAQKTDKVKVYSPRNCEELRIPFKADKMAKVVGKLASIPPPQEMPAADSEATPPLVTGVLVQNDFKLSLMAPEDLREYAGLNTTTITCKQRLTLSAAGVDLIKWALEGTFGTIEELPEMRRGNAAINGKSPDGEVEKKEEEQKEEEEADEEVASKPEEADEEIASLVAAYLVMGCVTVRYRTDGEVELEWEGNMLNDGIADSVMAVLFSVESSPAAVKRSGNNSPHAHAHAHGPQPGDTNPHAHPTADERLERLFWFLEAQFGIDNVSPVETPRMKKEETDETPADDAMALDKGDAAARELERLHKLGLPVPGVSIKVDKMTATVWLEDMDVESAHKVFADRVRAVVERAVEVTAPLWA